MTHLISSTNPNYVSLAGIYFTTDPSFEQGDTVKIQSGRDETTHNACQIIPTTNFLKKGYRIVILEDVEVNS